MADVLAPLLDVFPARFAREPEGYLPDVIERMHKNCYWRERSGSCNICSGTPFANT